MVMKLNYRISKSVLYSYYLAHTIGKKSNESTWFMFTKSVLYGLIVFRVYFTTTVKILAKSRCKTKV